MSIAPSLHLAVPGWRHSRRLLDPVDRFGEVLFGLIMVLTFTGSLSVATVGRQEVRLMLVAAVGCNVAWGVIDAVMYLLQAQASRRREAMLWRGVGGCTSADAARELLAEAMPDWIASSFDDEVLLRLSRHLAEPGLHPPRVRLDWRDYGAAAAVCVLVIGSALPVAAPFLFMHDARVAMRVSNAVAVVLLFVTGWQLARHSGGRPLTMGGAMVGIGLALVAMTMALGG